MGTVSTTLPADGQTIDASDVNTPINAILAEFNGNIDNDNIKAAANISGSKLADDSVPNTKIDFGGSGAGVWWEEIARTTLSSTNDTISVTSIPARKYLQVVIIALNSGQIGATLRFNNDTGANYATRTSTNGAADATAVSATSILLSDAQTQKVEAILFAGNIAAQEKQITGSVSRNPTGAANAPGRIEVAGKWANTADQISRVDIVNTGTGDFASGSEVVIMGHD